jgi:hypothetical protein
MKYFFRCATVAYDFNPPTLNGYNHKTEIL